MFDVYGMITFPLQLAKWSWQGGENNNAFILERKAEKESAVKLALFMV